MKPVVQVNPSIVSSHLMRNLPFLQSSTQVQNTALQASLVIQCFPKPLAVCLGNARDASCFERMKHVQEHYRNCVAIVMCEDEEQWNRLNFEFPPGVLRLHWVENEVDMCALLTKLYAELSLASAGDNLKAQAKFFEEAKNRLCHSRHACKAYVETLGQLGIPSADREGIMRRFPSHKHLITTDYRKMAKTNPKAAGLANLQSIGYFFDPA
jgi:hypothetical protein